MTRLPGARMIRHPSVVIVNKQSVSMRQWTFAKKIKQPVSVRLHGIVGWNGGILTSVALWWLSSNRCCLQNALLWKSYLLLRKRTKNVICLFKQYVPPAHIFSVGFWAEDNYRQVFWLSYHKTITSTNSLQMFFFK